MIKTKRGIYQSELLDAPSIVHGFSTKQFGDMTDKKKRKIFLSALGIGEEFLVWQEQIHKGAIRVVAAADRGTTISGADGLMYKKIQGNDQITLSVHTADCVPLLAHDPIEDIIGAAHAGWKGTILHIGKNLIKEIERSGANRRDIRVVIGPRIGKCCYEIDENRTDAFRTEFSESDVVEEREGKLFADIGKANYIDFLSIGIKPEHIDYDPSLCTCCKADDFYSFRKSQGVLEGEMLGVIGFRQKGRRVGNLL